MLFRHELSYLCILKTGNILEFSFSFFQFSLKCWDYHCFRSSTLSYHHILSYSFHYTTLSQIFSCKVHSFSKYKNCTCPHLMIVWPSIENLGPNLLCPKCWKHCSTVFKHSARLMRSQLSDFPFFILFL